MTSTRMWMIRAGRNAVAFDSFMDEGLVAIGWGAASGMPLGSSREEVLQQVRKTLPKQKSSQQTNAAGQIYRFLSEIEVGEQVCTYEPAQRRYCIGTMLAGEGSRDAPQGRYRSVDWTHHVSRDGLSAPTRNSLGAIQTLFKVPEAAMDELLTKAVPIGSDLERSSPAPVSGDTSDLEVLTDGSELDNASDDFDDIAAKSAQLIEDAIVRLEWDEVQDLVAGILCGMGYRSQVSPKGADRGVDIIASPDGLGLQEPRIFVEVKHRRGSAMGAPDLRAFLGGRQAGDRCLYASTGGFTKEARYEAERSAIPVTLVDLPRLRELLVEHYAKLDSATTALLPLQHLYWPAN